MMDEITPGGSVSPDATKQPISHTTGTPDQVRLGDLTVSLSKPREVAGTSEGRCWYPDLVKFSTGELMLNHSLNADANDNLANAQAVYISTDQGKTFDFQYDVNGFHNGGGEPRISLPDGRIVGMSTFLKPDPVTQARRFVAHYWTYDQGGRRYCVEPWAVQVHSLPRDVGRYPKPSRTWWNQINWFSDIVRLDGRQFLSTLSLSYEGDNLATTVALISEDEGRNWHYLSTIAGCDAVPDAREGFDEPCLIRLADGDLMCVSRVGSGRAQHLARTYSSDNGRTWSPVDRLPAYSVAPQICRTTNGTFVLSTGRPGLFLWFSTDSRARNWQAIDVMRYHNEVLDQASQMSAEQTTAYTAMIIVSENRVLLAYDRTPFCWDPVPADSGERSQIYLLDFCVHR